MEFLSSIYVFIIIHSRSSLNRHKRQGKSEINQAGLLFLIFIKGQYIVVPRVTDILYHSSLIEPSPNMAE